MAHTTENCPIVEKAMGDLEASYDEMLADDTKGGNCHKTGKFHESIIHTAIFPIKTLPQFRHSCPAHQIGDSFETLPNFANQNNKKKPPG